MIPQTIPFWFCLLVIVSGALLCVWSYRIAVTQGIATELLFEAKPVVAKRKPHHTTQTKYPAKRYYAWVVGACIFITGRLLIGANSGIAELLYVALGALAGEMFFRVRAQGQREKQLRRIEFHLPTAMERVVMAVGAGLDVIPALAEASRQSDDPVSMLMAQVVELSDAGMPVEDAFSTVSGQALSPSLRHAFVHLGLAYRQGGEIVRPLRELSDATQVQYQESIEEQIAKLPVKAVLPLVLTFAGLIVCFLTVPLMQVGSITARVAHVAQQQK